MLLKKDESCLLLIDVQEKLAPFIVDSADLIKRCDWLMNLAEELDVPLLISEQYPKGLGSTVKPLHSKVTKKNHIEKVHFSCARNPDFKSLLNTLNKKQLILIGIETHVCVLQTALDLIGEDYEIFVVVDAVSSRSVFDHKYGLKRMRHAGVELITSEMVFFEWLEQSDNAKFKSLSKKFIQNKG